MESHTADFSADFIETVRAYFAERGEVLAVKAAEDSTAWVTLRRPKDPDGYRVQILASVDYGDLTWAAMYIDAPDGRITLSGQVHTHLLC